MRPRAEPLVVIHTACCHFAEVKASDNGRRVFVAIGLSEILNAGSMMAKLGAVPYGYVWFFATNGVEFCETPLLPLGQDTVSSRKRSFRFFVSACARRGTARCSE